MDVAALKIQITADVQQAVQNLKNAESALSNLNQAVGKFDFKNAVSEINNLKGGLGALKNDVLNGKASLDTFGTASINLSGKLGGLGSVIGSLSSYLLEMVNPATLAIAGITALGAALYKFATSETEAARSQRELNEAMIKGSASVAGEIANLNSLVDIAKNVNLSYGERQAAIEKINKEYPALNNSISLETINTRGVTKALNEQAESLKRNASIKAVMALIDKESLKIEAIRSVLSNKNLPSIVTFNLIKDLKEASNQVDIYTKRLDDLNTESTKINSGGKPLVLFQPPDISFKDELQKLENQHNHALSLVQGNRAKILQVNIEFDKKEIALRKQFGENASKVELDLARLSNPLPVLNKKETVADVLKQLGRELDFLSTKELAFKTDEAKAKVAAINSTLEQLFKKFGLKANNPLIIDLLFKAKDIKEKDALLKEVFGLGGKNARALEIPVTLTLGGGAITNNNTVGIQAEDLRKRMAALGTEAGQILRNTITAALSGVGEDIGKALGGEKVNIFGDLFQVFGEGLKTFGKALIEYGVGLKVLRLAFKNPATAIIAGVGLEVLGSFIQSKIPKFATGGIVPPGYPNDTYLARLTSGERIIPAGKSDFSGNVSMVYIPTVTLRGQDLVVAFNRANQTLSRNG